MPFQFFFGQADDSGVLGQFGLIFVCQSVSSVSVTLFPFGTPGEPVSWFCADLSVWGREGVGVVDWWGS